LSAGSATASLGGWLFAARGWLPVPLALLAVLLARGGTPWVVGGLVVVAAGEALRMWGVAWIGGRSRTRGDDVGPLVTSGPYRWSRNPLYVGNLVMWAGVGLLTGRWWAVPLLVGPLALHYALVVRWEEQNLRQKLGPAYVAWCRHTARWVGPPGPVGEGRADWPAALRSERSTLLAAILVSSAVVLAGALRCG